MVPNKFRLSHSSVKAINAAGRAVLEEMREDEIRKDELSEEERYQFFQAIRRESEKKGKQRNGKRVR